MLKIYRYLEPYTIPILAILALVFLQSLADLYLPTLMSDIVNKGITNSDINYILNTGSCMLLVALAGSLCAIGASFFSSHVAAGLGEILRQKIFSHITQFSLAEFDQIGPPSLITRTTNDVNQIQTVTIILLRMMLSAPIMCVGGIILALSKDRGLAWIIVFVIPILFTVIIIAAAKGFPLFLKMQKKIDRLNLLLRERLTGVRVIRAFHRSADEEERFQDANLELTQIAIKVNKIMATILPIVMLCINLTTLAIIWFGSIRIDAGTTNVGNMIAFLQYALQILFSLLMASLMLIMLPRAQASAARINEVLALKPSIKDFPALITRRSSLHLRGLLEFEHVSFSYPGAEEDALFNISFKARPGETTAIIGPTGAGKSTLINLIPRFYEVSSGRILLDGIDIRELEQEDLRSRLGLVPQKAILFSGTIYDNIRFGREDVSPQEIEHAAEIAQALEFIQKMPQGFESLIAQGGTNISGGQKQRLAIARALVGKPEIYLFDDSFSALDFKTEAKLRQALKRETNQATVIIVGQRVATIMDADHIIVLEDGKIVGRGKHCELYQNCSVYREIVVSQLSEDEIV